MRRIPQAESAPADIAYYNRGLRYDLLNKINPYKYLPRLAIAAGALALVNPHNAESTAHAVSQLQDAKSRVLVQQAPRLEVDVVVDEARVEDPVQAANVIDLAH